MRPGYRPHPSRRRFAAPQDEGLLASRPPSLGDLPLQPAVDVVRRDRADQLEGDGAIAPDNESFGHAIDAPFDRGAAIAVDPDNAEWIAIAAEEAPRVLRLVLV